MNISVKLLSLLLVFALALTLLPGQAAFAEPVSLADENDGLSGEPVMADGEYVRAIDRVANLPDYAMELYTWMEENDSGTGALIDPTQMDQISGYYCRMLTIATGTLDFTYTTSARDAAVEKTREHALELLGVVMDYGTAAVDAFLLDHPEVFWFNGLGQYFTSYGCTYTYDPDTLTGTAEYTIRFYFSAKSSSYDIRDSKYQDVDTLTAAIDQRDADADAILAGCPMDAPVDEQLRYLNNTLTQTNAYNSGTTYGDGNRDPWACVSALDGRWGDQGPVCEGYAKAFKLLCDKLEIPCVLVTGDAKSSASGTAGGHMWNYVQVSDSWYAVDVTWNDPVVYGVSNDTPLSGYEYEHWFLLGSDTVVNTDLTFIQSHPIDNVVSIGGFAFDNMPTISTQAYVRPEGYMDIAPYRSAGGYTAPEQEGYLFAGWYADAAFTQPLTPGQTTGWAYAKFVDEQVLTIKYQITGGTTAESASTNLRLLTGVDSLDYASIQFDITFGGSTKVFEVNTVYSTINAGGVAITDPKTVFGDQAGYFVTVTVSAVPQGAFDTAMTVVPCWVTLDGTNVEGSARAFAVSDAF